MRVLVYAPAGMWGRERHVDAMHDEVDRLGFQYAGELADPAAARAARESGLVDRIACRTEHLPDLVDWALVIDPHLGKSHVPVVLAAPLVLAIEKAGVWITDAVHTL